MFAWAKQPYKPVKEVVGTLSSFLPHLTTNRETHVAMFTVTPALEFTDVLEKI